MQTKNNKIEKIIVKQKKLNEKRKTKKIVNMS